MSYTVHPMMVIAGVCAVVAMISVVFVIRVKGTKIRVALSAFALALLSPSFLVVMVFYPWLIDSRFRVYRSFYQDIKIGMTRNEVLELAKHHYPKGGPREFPIVMSDEPNHLGFFMNPEGDRQPNCEGIFLDFKEGRVVSVSYSAD